MSTDAFSRVLGNRRGHGPAPAHQLGFVFETSVGEHARGAIAAYIDTRLADARPICVWEQDDCVLRVDCVGVPARPAGIVRLHVQNLAGQTALFAQRTPDEKPS